MNITSVGYLIGGSLVLVACIYLMFSLMFKPMKEHVTDKWLMRFFVVRLVTVWAQTFTPDNGLDMRSATILLVTNQYLHPWELEKFVRYEVPKCLAVAAQNPRTPQTSLDKIVSSPRLRNTPGVTLALLSNPKVDDFTKTLWALQFGVPSE